MLVRHRGWGDEALVLEIRARIDIMPLEEFLPLVHHIRKRDVRPVEKLAQVAIPIEEILQVKDRAVPHRIARQALDELAMTPVDRLQRLPLMLHATPRIPQLVQLLHLPAQELRRGREDLALLAALVVGAVHVDRAGGADAVADEGGPFDGGALLAQLHELGDGVGVQEAEVRGLDLPGLVLAGSGEFGEVDGEEGPVDEAVDEMIDQFAEDEGCAVGLAEEGIDGGEDVLGSRGPDIEILSYFG